MWTQVGSCPKCGAPIWSPMFYWSVLPPPSTPSCSCNPSSYTTTTGANTQTVL